LIKDKALLALAKGVGPKSLVASISRHLASIKRFEVGSARKHTFEVGRNHTPVSPQEPMPKLRALATVRPRKVIVAIIDDVLAFAHERFRDGDGRTRFKYFWNQDDDHRNPPPKGFGWGTEFTDVAINKLLADHTHSGIVDEDALYQSAQLK